MDLGSSNGVPAHCGVELVSVRTLSIWAAVVCGMSPVAAQEAQLFVSTIASGVGASGGLTIGPDGALYASSFWGAAGPFGPGGSRIQRIALDGGVSTFAEGVHRPTGLVWSASGDRLFVSSYSTGLVLAIDPTGDIVDTVARGVTGPAGLAFDTLGRLLIGTNPATQMGGNQVFRISTDGNVELVIEDERLNGPGAIGSLSDGSLLIGNYRDGKLFRWSEHHGLGELADLPDHAGMGIGHITVVNDTAYVSAIGSHRIFRITPDGRLARISNGGYGHSDGPAEFARFQFPNGIAAGHDGVFILETIPARIRRLSQSGRHMRTIPSLEFLSGGIAVESGVVYVGDYAGSGGPTAPNGRLIWRLDSAASIVEEVALPSQMGVLNGRLMVLSALDSTLHMRTDSGFAPLRSSIAALGGGPHRIALVELRAGMGRLLIVDGSGDPEELSSADGVGELAMVATDDSLVWGATPDGGIFTVRPEGLTEVHRFNGPPGLVLGGISASGRPPFCFTGKSTQDCGVVGRRFDEGRCWKRGDGAPGRACRSRRVRFPGFTGGFRFQSLSGRYWQRCRTGPGHTGDSGQSAIIANIVIFRARTRVRAGLRANRPRHR